MNFLLISKIVLISFFWWSGVYIGSVCSFWDHFIHFLTIQLTKYGSTSFDPIFQAEQRAFHTLPAPAHSRTF